MVSPIPLVVIVGATGTGKSALSLDLADGLLARGQNAEIVNADAMQLYRGMNVGTAKLPVSERRGVPHWLFDVLDVTAEASVAAYQSDARSVIADIVARGAIPVLVGGSGLYVSSVIYDYRFPARDPLVRAGLEKELLETGPGVLYQRLRVRDPAAAESIGPHNGRRLVRALEVVEITGAPFYAGLPDETEYWRSPTITIGLRAKRAELVARLDERVLGIWRDGLVDEVHGLLPLGLERGVTASRAIGYAQAVKQLAGELSEAEAIAQTAALTRKYARRQVSWFKRYPHTTWIDYGDESRIEKALGLVTG